METVRYYQARRALPHDMFDFSAFPTDRPAGPLPARITERVLFTPDVGVYLCSAERSTYVRVLDYDAEFDTDVSDELREWWHDQLIDARTPDDDYYIRRADIVRAYDVTGPVDFTPFFAHVAYQGEHAVDEDAVEYAHGNHLV